MTNLVNAEAAKACQLGNIHKLQSYLKKSPALLHGCDIEGNTLLTLACRENRIKIVELLLNPPYSANINQANQTGYSPLITAATEGHLNLVELLLSRGANINQQNNNGWTALMCACCFRRIEIVQKLLESSATVNTASNTGCTALYLACSAGSEKAVELLLQYSAEPNICSNSGCSPLHLAAENSNKPIIALLIEGGASTSALDHQDRTPLQVARSEDVRKFIRTTYQEHIEHPKPKKPVPPKKPPRISKSLKSTDTSPNNETPTTLTTIIPAPEITSVQPSSTTEVVAYSSGSLIPSETRQPQVQFTQYQDLLQQLSSLNYENLQYLSQTSSKSLHYLTDLSNEALSLKYEWKYIQSQPFLAEYYSYCQRCFTSVILSLQVLLSDNIADNRTTNTETVFSTIDTITNATGINCLPLVTALVKYIVSIPFNRDRKKTIENITTFFPSISSHQIIDLFIHEITLLEEKNIQSIMKINKKIKKYDLIEKLYENQQLISWMFEEVKLTFFPQSSSSSPSSSSLSQNKFSYTIIQAYADIQLSRIFTKLMYHSGDGYNKKQLVVDEMELKRQAVSKEMMWQLHSIALDLPLTKENEEKITTDLARIHETFQRKRYEEESMTSPQTNSPPSPLTITIANPAIPAPEVKELPRPSSVRYRDIIVSLEEKLSLLQEQLQETQRHSSLMSTQQQQEIVVMKEQLERVSQLQEQQQQLQQFQPTSSALSPSPPPPQSGGGRRSSLSSPQVLLHKQDQSQKSSSVEGLEGGGSDESLIDTQTRLMMQQAYMSETLYAVIQQLQLIQDQLPPTSTSSSSVVALDEIDLGDGEEEGKTAERQSSSNNNNDKTTDSERKALTRGCYCIIQ